MAVVVDSLKDLGISRRVVGGRLPVAGGFRLLGSSKTKTEQLQLLGFERLPESREI
jgi:hypothetical protein